MVTGTDITEEKAVSDTGLQTLDSRNTQGPSWAPLGAISASAGMIRGKPCRGRLEGERTTF